MLCTNLIPSALPTPSFLIPNLKKAKGEKFPLAFYHCLDIFNIPFLAITVATAVIIVIVVIAIIVTIAVVWASAEDTVTVWTEYKN